MKGFLTSLLALTFTGLQAQSLPATPKLVVSLTIDQLRTDYIEAFSSLYGEQGFKRMWKEGCVYQNVEFPFVGVDRASAMAAIYTGTTPSYNGIIGENWLNISTLRPMNCVDDPAYMGNYTTESSSPELLLSSTLTDELKIATQGRGLVYAISPFRDAAILAAGHNSNGAFWLNEETGKWCGTTYYSDFPWWVSQFNDRGALDFRIANISWTPYHPIEKYNILSAQYPSGNFKYKFDDFRKNKYRRLITSPFVNDEVNLLVEQCLEHSTIGQDEVPDFLALTYYGGNYNHQSIREVAAETQDAYVRLDQSIANLLNLLEKKVGLQNVLFVLTSTGYVDAETPDISKYRIPNGDFHLNRCAALLNVYLMATYGEGQYVEAYYDQYIYLNRKLIEKKQLALSDVQEKASDFLVQFSGVSDVYSAHRLALGAWTPLIGKVKNSFNRRRSGDLFLEILPNWNIVDETTGHQAMVRNNYIPSPLILLGGSVKAKTITTPISIDYLAPTLARRIKIRAPSACQTAPLSE